METAIRRASKIVKGGFAGIGRELGGISHRTVWAWHSRGRVPQEYCPRIEEMTAGAVRCEELNPDVDWQSIRDAFAKTARKSRSKEAA